MVRQVRWGWEAGEGGAGISRGARFAHARMPPCVLCAVCMSADACNPQACGPLRLCAFEPRAKRRASVIRRIGRG